MFLTGLRWRRLWLGVLVATCSMTLYGGSASATLSFHRSLTVESDAHWWQGNLRPVTHGGYQYFATWDEADPVDGKVYLELIRRRLSDDDLVTLRFDGTGGSTAYDLTAHNDGHNFVGLGLSPNDGRLHISWSLHTSDRRHRYLQSSSGCMSQTQANFNFTNCRFTRRATQVWPAEDSMTYPTYFNDNSDRLYFSWRYASSENGDQYLNSYNDDGTWTAGDAIMRGRSPGIPDNTYTFDPDGAGPARSETTTERGIYIQEWEFDKDNRLHAMWVWREGGGGSYGQHGIHYAYSDDFGRTWYGRTRQIATASTDPLVSDPINITDLSETQVVALPPGWWTGASGFEIDSDNNPHLVWGASDVQTDDLWDSEQRQTHIWRTSNGTWHAQTIEARGDVRRGFPSIPGEIMLDRANNAHVLFSRDHIEWAPWNSNIYVQAEAPRYKFVWQRDEAGDGYMDVDIHSRTTCYDTSGYLGMSISTAGNNQVRVRMRNDSDARDVTISWTTETNQTWDVARQQRFTGVLTTRDRNYTDYTFTITDADWRDTLRELEICPAAGVSSGDQRIDWIRLTNSATRADAKRWEFARPVTLYTAEASQADNWSTWSVAELFAEGTAISPEDGYFYVDWQRYLDDQIVSFNIVQQGVPGNELLSLREYRVAGDDILKDWRFDTDTIGWTVANHVSGFAWANDAGTKGVGGTITGNDSAIVSRVNLDIPIDGDGDFVHAVMKNSSDARTARFWFRTVADRTWTVAKSASFAITARSGYTEYDIDMSRVAGWDRSMLYQVELDPADDATNRGSFNVDRIYINDTR